MDKFVPAVGKARRSQGVFGFGPGAIVDFPGGSFMPLGLHQMEMLWSDLPVEAKSDIASQREKRLGLAATKTQR